MSGLTTLLVIAAIVCFVMWLVTMRKEKEAMAGSASAPPSGIAALEAGGVMSVEGLDYIVQQKNRYSAGSSEWFEVKLVGDGDEVWWLGWEEDDEPVITMMQEADFHELGLSPDDLDALDEEGGEIVVDGHAYHLDESGDALFHENCQPSGEPFYYWDFRDSEMEQTIGIECWGDSDYRASVGRFVDGGAVDIYRAGEEED